jgi:ribosomal protein S18 acetylase RimI-like enzyme
LSVTSRSSSPSAQAADRPAPRGELVPAPQLSPTELDAVAVLEEECRAHDGGRLKLEWRSLRDRPAGTTGDFVWVDGGEIVGFAGLYQWRPLELEICGMVHPVRRRSGIGSRLYDAAIAEATRRAPARALLIVDRLSGEGRRFALGRGGELEHSEHRMQQRRDPEERAELPPVTTRQATQADADFIVGCLAAAFEEEPAVYDPGDEAAVLGLVDATTIIVEASSADPVGMMRVEREGGAASIYGFAVVPERQGRGYGRAALSMVTRQLHRSGVGVVSLEVMSTNDSALHLYETCGFDAIGTEDYYSMPLGS